jgi:hypothetical protein
MTKEADEFNRAEFEAGALQWRHITELVTHWQETHGLTADGKAGTLQTIPSLETAIMNRNPPVVVQAEELSIDAAGWPVGPRVQRLEMDDSWHGGTMAAGKPLGIVAHYSATDAGTAVNMAKRRQRMFGEDPDDRLASWHLSIETDGSIVVMVRTHHRAWHAGSATAQPIPGIGSANANTVGIELIGFGKQFPDAQVEAACKVWRALVRRYGIKREHAMITHQSIDPTRRQDPGPVWMAQHAQKVLDFAFAPG